MANAMRNSPRGGSDGRDKVVHTTVGVKKEDDSNRGSSKDIARLDDLGTKLEKVNYHKEIDWNGGSGGPSQSRKGT